MTLFAQRIVALFALGAGATCVVYTDPVNEPPSLSPISIPPNDGGAPLMPLSFSTSSAERDLTYQWATSAACPGDLAAATATTAGAAVTGASFTPPADATAGAFCVTVVGKDSLGAAAFRTRAVVDRRVSVAGPATVPRTGDPARFTAAVTVEGVAVSAEIRWAVAAVCPTNLAEATALTTIDSGPSVGISATPDTGCVVATSLGAYGAKPVSIGNGAPTLTVDLLDDARATTAAPVYTRYQPIVARVRTTDPEDDGVTITAQLAATSGDPAPRDLERCPNDDAVSFCFSVVTAGAYEIVVAGTDDLGATAVPVRRSFVVKDAAPCLASLSPAPLAGSGSGRIFRFGDAGPVRFAVDRVIDDADPFPAAADGRPHHGAFFWRIGAAGAATNVDNEPTGTVTVDLRAYRNADTLEVRVEYRDSGDLDKGMPFVENAAAAGPPQRGPCDRPGEDHAVCGPPACPSRFTWTVALR